MRERVEVAVGEIVGLAPAARPRCRRGVVCGHRAPMPVGAATIVGDDDRRDDHGTRSRCDAADGAADRWRKLVRPPRAGIAEPFDETPRDSTDGRAGMPSR